MPDNYPYMPSLPQSIRPNSRREDVWLRTGAINTSLPNRFENYTEPFSYDSMKAQLDQIYNQYRGIVSRNTGASLQDARQSTVARMASQGITGGSVLNNAVRSGENNILNKGFDAYTQLGIGEASQLPGLMQTANQNKFNITQAAGDIDYKSLIAELQKNNMLSGQINSWEQADMQRDVQNNPWNDVMGALKIGANVALPFLTGGASLPFQAGNFALSQNPQSTLSNFNNTADYYTQQPLSLR